MNFLNTTRRNISTSIWKTNGKAHTEKSDTQDSYTVFEKIRAAGHQAVLLETGGNAGWSFIGIVNEKVKVPQSEAGLAFIRKFLKKHHRAHKRGAPPFCQGFVGFLSYDLGERWMGVKKGPPHNHRMTGHRGAQQGAVGSNRQQQAPEAYFVYVDKVIAFPKKEGNFVSGTNKVFASLAGRVARHSNLTFAQYSKKLGKIKNYLYSGHTYQVNFSQRFEVPYQGEAFELYKKITAINPSPFQFFLETPDFAIISNSPERLMRVRKSIIETRPIKGTAPRGKTLQEDKKNIQKLLASEKEKAELAMIVDLERNDIGKICVPGTVEVTEERTVEKYSHVIHTAANIRGVMGENYDWYDALRAVFPGGSITGCPKKRTMEIIEELENSPRGIYCGSAGYIDLSGACDFNILIRTLWLQKTRKHSKIIFNSGGGIVVDSKVKNEYEETLQKAAAIISAITE